MWSSRSARKGSSCRHDTRGGVVSAIELRDEQWPVCFIRIDGEQSMFDYEKYIDSFNRLYDRKEPFAVVSFVKSYRARGEIIKRTGRWFKETEPLIKNTGCRTRCTRARPGSASS